MHDEPYRWIEAMGNRRTYLDDQFKQGSPVVGLAYESGILLLTVSRGTPKLYEIYDRLALGGMGHPADLEKLRFSLLEMAHIEGFDRSPSDVTGSRLVKYGVAPVIKQAFEEIFKAPFIVKVLLAEIGHKPEKDMLLTINYDGTFEETNGCAVLAATPSVQEELTAYLRQETVGPLPLAQAVSLALHAWALGAIAHERESDGSDQAGEKGIAAKAVVPVDKTALIGYLRKYTAEKAVECAVLDRNLAGSSKYRPVKADELGTLLSKDLREALTG